MFLHNFFSELADKTQLKNANCLLLHFRFTEDEPMMMDDMKIVMQFIEGIGLNEKIKWGLTQLPEGEQTSILLLATNECRH